MRLSLAKPFESQSAPAKAPKSKAPAGFPENASIMIVAIYDLMRGQRNDLGHPCVLPPRVKREDAFVNLQIFPRDHQIRRRDEEFLAINPGIALSKTGAVSASTHLATL